MLFYLSVLSAYLKKNKKTGLPKPAGGYDLIFKNTDMRKRTRLSFFVVFEMVVLFCCSDCFVHCLALVLDLAVALTRPILLIFFLYFFRGKKTSDRCREPLGGGETVQ